MISKSCCSLVVERAPAVWTLSQITGIAQGSQLPPHSSEPLCQSLFFSFCFPWSVMAFWHMFCTEETGCLFSVTSGFTYANSLPHTPKIKYVGTDPNLFWKRFYLPSQLLLLKHFDTPVVDEIQELIWLSPPSCERTHAEMPMQSPKADSEVLQTHIHTHGCSQSRVRATEVSRWPQFIVWTERRPKGKW